VRRRLTSTRSWARGVVYAGSALALASCVVTPYEGPGDPPRVAPHQPPPVGKPSPAASGSASAERPTAGPRSIAASHILVMHVGSLGAPPTITRSKEEARARAEEALVRAKAGEDFGKLVREYSDEPGAAAREGRLGRFTREDMIAPFASAAFRLQPGELSGIVETQYGFHVILRTE
jgi:hypothetical protein